MSEYNRRTLVRGAAWSIPVLAVAAQAPAFAASTDVPSISGTGAFTACKQPGGPNGPNCQGYRFTLNLTVQPSDTWDIVFTQLLVDGSNFLDVTVPTTFTVTSTSSILNFVLCTASSPSQFDLTLRYSATNQRTGATTTNLGGVYALSGVRNC